GRARARRGDLPRAAVTLGGVRRGVVGALLRGRPAVAFAVGGIRDVVEDGVNGLLVSSDEELADALVLLLSDRGLAERLAAGARRSADRFLATPEQYAARVAALVEPYTSPR